MSKESFSKSNSLSKTAAYWLDLHIFFCGTQPATRRPTHHKCLSSCPCSPRLLTSRSAGNRYRYLHTYCACITSLRFFWCMASSPSTFPSRPSSSVVPKLPRGGEGAGRNARVLVPCGRSIPYRGKSDHWCAMVTPSFPYEHYTNLRQASDLVFC